MGRACLVNHQSSFSNIIYHIIIIICLLNCAGGALHVRRGRANDEVVGRHGGRIQDVRVRRVREPNGTHQRRFGQGADGTL